MKNNEKLLKIIEDEIIEAEDYMKDRGSTYDEEIDKDYGEEQNNAFEAGIITALNLIKRSIEHGTKNEYMFQELPNKIKDQVLMEASFLTATEGDDLIKSQERAQKWVDENNYPKTIEHWTTRP